MDEMADKRDGFQRLNSGSSSEAESYRQIVLIIDYCEKTACLLIKRPNLSARGSARCYKRSCHAGSETKRQNIA